MSDYEQARLYMLRQLKLLDTPPSESFDRITRMASQLFNLPIAAISLTDQDRQWFKSRVGVDHWEIPRFKACCAEVTDSCEVLVVPDLLASSTYADSLLADSGIRFYAGAPLQTREGYTLGAMCVLGTEPRQATEQELALLKDLAAMVMAQIELQHAFGRVEPQSGLPNRSQFLEDALDLARDQPGQAGYVFSTELVDIRQICSMQRVMGSNYLDDLSKASAQCLQETLGSEVKLYHTGPGQFVHWFPVVDDSNALQHALHLRERLLAMHLGSAAPFMLQPVTGIAPVQFGEISPAEILRLAHSASQDARQAELGASIYSLDLDASHKRSFTLINEFPHALASAQQLHLMYQPRVAMTSGGCVGAEALIRWTHPELGNIGPVEFIPLVENTPLARELTDWVLKQAIKQCAQWRKAGLHLRVSINVAAANLQEEDFTERLVGYLTQAGVPLHAIELELTESGLISNGRAATQQLNALMEQGVHIAIDDFGTGYSSLAYLQKIPAHVVKIDRSFITRLDRDERSQSLVRSMISMAQDLGYRVVAEGVETRESYDLLNRLGCDEVQGYWLAKPLSPADFETWWAEREEGAASVSSGAR